MSGRFWKKKRISLQLVFVYILSARANEVAQMNTLAPGCSCAKKNHSLWQEKLLTHINVKKYLHTFKSGFARIKEAAHQLFISIVLFSSSRSSKNSLSASKLETRSSKLDSQSSKIETRASKLVSLFLKTLGENRELSFESRLSTYL